MGLPSNHGHKCKCVFPASFVYRLPLSNDWTPAEMSISGC